MIVGTKVKEVAEPEVTTELAEPSAAPAVAAEWAAAIDLVRVEELRVAATSILRRG